MLGYRLEPQSKFTMSDRNTLSSSQRAPWLMAYCQDHSTIHVPWILGCMPEPPSIHVQWGQVYSHEPITACLQLKLEVWASHNRCATSASSRFWVATQEIHNGCWVVGILFPRYMHHECCFSRHMSKGTVHHEYCVTVMDGPQPVLAYCFRLS